VVRAAKKEKRRSFDRVQYRTLNYIIIGVKHLFALKYNTSAGKVFQSPKSYFHLSHLNFSEN
jgi:hypothetical protein